jgi:hypothetical protein
MMMKRRRMRMVCLPKRRRRVSLNCPKMTVDWVKNNPMLWDPSDDDYFKSKQKKDMWADKAKTLDPPLSYHQIYLQWWKSLRSKYGRLTKPGKSGSGLTEEQKRKRGGDTKKSRWVLQHLAFLDSCIHRQEGRTVGVSKDIFSLKFGVIAQSSGE